MLVNNNSGGSTLPFHVRQDSSCSTFHPGPTATSTLGRHPHHHHEHHHHTRPSHHPDEGFVSFSAGGRSMGSLRGSRGFYSADSATEDSRRSSGRRRDWRVVDSSPSEIEASWASQQLLSPPTHVSANGGNVGMGPDSEVIEVDETSSPTATGYDSGGFSAGSVVMRRGAGERRGSNPMRPSSWKNDRRRSSKTLKLLTSSNINRLGTDLFVLVEVLNNTFRK